jgi:hypothetical protein
MPCIRLMVRLWYHVNCRCLRLRNRPGQSFLCGTMIVLSNCVLIVVNMHVSCLKPPQTHRISQASDVVTPGSDQQQLYKNMLSAMQYHWRRKGLLLLFAAWHLTAALCSPSLKDEQGYQAISELCLSSHHHRSSSCYIFASNSWASSLEQLHGRQSPFAVVQSLYHGQQLPLQPPILTSKYALACPGSHT